jgi:hypothetical protein
MLALGCVQSLRCHTGTCPTGITTQDPLRQRGLVIEDKAERVTRFHKTTLDVLKELVAAAGLDHPQEFEPHHLHHRISAVEMRTVDRIYPFLRPNELLDDPENTPYADWWRVADADSFRPRRDVAPMRQPKFEQSQQKGDLF